MGVATHILRAARRKAREALQYLFRLADPLLKLVFLRQALYLKLNL